MKEIEDRYTKDRERIDLALRMIHHEARTTTIRHWTGLTDDRIRKLYHTYVVAVTPGVRRHRGKSPTQTAFFLKNAAHRRQTATLAGLFALLGLLQTTESAPVGSVAALERGIDIALLAIGAQANRVDPCRTHLGTSLISITCSPWTPWRRGCGARAAAMRIPTPVHSVASYWGRP